MRIAFVGKGGSGKSTLSAVFGLYLEKYSLKKTLLIDADLNIHIPELVIGDYIKPEKFLSNKGNKQKIFSWLIGNDSNLKLSELKKTTTPTTSSNLITSESIKSSPLESLSLSRGKIDILAVGTYENNDIGASCYHNSLAVLETILNFTDDKDLNVVVDMVAGIDSFAGTMHAQFDITVLIVEPTKRSIEVFEQYLPLAKEAGVADGLFVIANKIQTKEDEDFIKRNIPEDKLLGFFESDPYIRQLDKTGAIMNIDNINSNNLNLIERIYLKYSTMPDNRNNRLQAIRNLHNKYVSQAYVIRANGDLRNQIDGSFKFL